MQIIDVAISSLKPAEYNPRRMTVDQHDRLKESIEKFGLVDPIIVNNHADRENIVIGGHQRLKIAQELGMENVPVVYVDLDEDRERELNLRLNKNNGEWDYDMLANHFSLNMLTEVGFSELELGMATKAEEDAGGGGDSTMLEPVTKLGDMYLLGGHKLVCGDSTDPTVYARLFAASKLAQLVFTDPPYNVGYDYSGERGTREEGVESEEVFDDEKTPEEYGDFIKAVFQNCFDFTDESASFYCWHASRMESWVRGGIEACGWHISQTLIWIKEHLILSRGQDYHRIYEPAYFGWKKGNKHYVEKKIGTNWDELQLLGYADFLDSVNAMYERRDDTKEYKHPTQKPVRLAERALSKHSRINDVVLEPFGGSGSTLIACEQMKRQCYCIELDPKFCDVIVSRWESLTGEKAKKL